MSALRIANGATNSMNTVKLSSGQMPPVKPKPQRVEDGIQRAVIQTATLYAGQCPALRRLYAIPNGGQRSKIEAAILKGLGVRAGMPDLHLPVSRCHGIESHLNEVIGQYHSLSIEMKKPGGVLSFHQYTEIAALQHHGNCVQVCDSLEKAWAVLCWYLEPTWPDAGRALREVCPTLPELQRHGRYVTQEMTSPRRKTDASQEWFEGATPEEAADFLRFYQSKGTP